MSWFVPRSPQVVEDKQKHLWGLERDRWRECRNFDARSTGVEAFDTSTHPLFGFDPAIVPMNLFLTECTTFAAAAAAC
jgi:hypothetical protein